MDSKLVRNLCEASELDLVKLYYRAKFNADAQRRRASEQGGKLGDKYIVIPRIRQMDKCLNSCSGIEDFFERDEVAVQGLTSGDFVTYVAGLMAGYMEYEKTNAIQSEGRREQNLIGTGWRN